MTRLGSVSLRRLAWALTLLLALSETALLHWLLLASGRSGLSPLGAALGALGIAAANLLTLATLRRLSWSVPGVWLVSRVYMLASLGALLSGPPLLLAFLLSSGTLWVAHALGGGAGPPGAAFVAGGTLALALGFGSILWGFLVGQRRVRVERVDLPMPGLRPELAGLRIAHISDLHIGRQLRAPRLRRYIERVNALEADLVALTGDIFDFDPAFLEEGCRELARLRARYGVFGVLGNHDVYTGAEAVAAALKRLTAIRLLRDEWTRLELDGTPLYLLGIDDPGQGWTQRDARSESLERLAREVPSDAARILLVHRPSFFRQAAELGLPVALAGHTHGGQISLPPPAHHHNISRLVSRWTRGLFHHGGAVLYVNRGLGVAGPPVRLNCPREIALLRLVPRR